MPSVCHGQGNESFWSLSTSSYQALLAGSPLRNLFRASVCHLYWIDKEKGKLRLENGTGEPVALTSAGFLNHGENLPGFARLDHYS